MKINKQLFEDVLSGKLKGTFVLRNGKKFSDKLLTDIYNATVVVSKTTYYFNGKPIVSDYNGFLDIIDFISDTNMKENELTIEIPEGKIVDWEESKKQNKIVLKDKQLTYSDICKKLFNGDGEVYYTDGNGEIYALEYYQYATDPNNATTVHQLKCILAKNMLANVAKYLNGEWKPKSGEVVTGLVLEGKDHNIKIPAYCLDADNCYFPQFAFKCQKLAQQAIEILGEETVKLALEPLGI